MNGHNQTNKQTQGGVVERLRQSTGPCVATLKEVAEEMQRFMVKSFGDGSANQRKDYDRCSRALVKLLGSDSAEKETRDRQVRRCGSAFIHLVAAWFLIDLLVS